MERISLEKKLECISREKEIVFGYNGKHTVSYYNYTNIVLTVYPPISTDSLIKFESKSLSRAVDKMYKHLMPELGYKEPIKIELTSGHCITTINDIKGGNSGSSGTIVLDINSLPKGTVINNP